MTTEQASGQVTKEQYAVRREIWYSALLIGEYQQGHGLLRDSENQFCCLGVACDIWSGEKNWERKPDASAAYEFVAFDGDKWHRQDTELPSPVREWLGMADHIGIFDTGIYDLETHVRLNSDEIFRRHDITDALTTEYTLAGLNDGGCSFETIVKICRLNPPGLWEEGTY